VAKVRERYARIAELGDLRLLRAGRRRKLGRRTTVARLIGYDDRALAVGRPTARTSGSACGAPVGFLALRAGGDGRGPRIRRRVSTHSSPRAKVGPSGKVIGVDMTPAMLEPAPRERRQGRGCRWVEFREGRLEALAGGDGPAPTP